MKFSACSLFSLWQRRGCKTINWPIPHHHSHLVPIFPLFWWLNRRSFWCKFIWISLLAAATGSLRKWPIETQTRKLPHTCTNHVSNPPDKWHMPVGATKTYLKFIKKKGIYNVGRRLHRWSLAQCVVIRFFCLLDIIWSQTQLKSTKATMSAHTFLNL